MPRANRRCARQPERVLLLHGVAVLDGQRLALVQRRLAEPERERAVGGDVPCPGHRGFGEPGAVVHRVKEPEPQRLLARQRLRGEEHPPDDALRQVPHQVPAAAAAPDRHLGQREAGPRRAHPHVGAGGDDRARPDRRAVDHGDARLRQVEQLPEDPPGEFLAAGIGLLGLRPGQRGELGHVGAGAERPRARRHQHHDGDLRIGGDPLECGADLLIEARRQGVDRRPVERDGGDPVRDLDPDLAASGV